MKSIEIENFRSIKGTEVHHLNDVNIFYGKNNSGKSNILNAIKFLSQSSGAPNFDDNLGDFETAVYKKEHGRDIKFSGSFEFTENEVDELEALSEGSEYEELNWKVPQFHLVISQEDDQPYPKEFEMTSTGKEDLIAKRTFDTDRDNSKSVLEYYTGEKDDGGGTPSIWEYRFGDGINTRQKIANTVLENMKTRFEHVDYLHPNRSVTRRYQTMSKMRGISESGENIHNRLVYLLLRNEDQTEFDEVKYWVSKFGRGELIRDVDRDGEVEMCLRDPVLDTEINIRDVGFGTRQIISFVTLGFLPETDTILIEEPERSLHPVAQRNLIDLLKKMKENGKQIFITTHSSVLLESLREDGDLDDFVSVYKVTKTEENPTGTKCDRHSSVEEISMEGLMGTTD
jgi:AAA15 family ATPase/GTPase